MTYKEIKIVLEISKQTPNHSGQVDDMSRLDSCKQGFCG